MKEPLCPLLNKACIEGKCKFWVHITGQHPQSGAAMDHFDCSVAWLPVLLVSQARHTVGVQASVDSMRNEVVQRQDTLNNVIKAATQPQALEDDHTHEYRQIRSAGETPG